MTYVKANVIKPTGIAPGKGGDKKALITVFDFDDILTEAQRDSKGIVIAGSHVFKSGFYAIQIYATIDSIVNKSASEGDIDAEGIIQQADFAHPGSKKEIREFRQNWLNRNIGIIVEKCSSGEKDQYGTSCAPLRMNFDATDDKDGNKCVFTFKSTNKGLDVAIYQGTITLDTVKDTVAADATSVDLANGEGEYQLTDNTVPTEITTCTNAVHNAIYTLLGSGGSIPATITKSNDFILKDGVTWTGNANATLTFRAYKSDAAAWWFIELART